MGLQESMKWLPHQVQRLCARDGTETWSRAPTNPTVILTRARMPGVHVFAYSAVHVYVIRDFGFVFVSILVPYMRWKKRKIFCSRTATKMTGIIVCRGPIRVGRKTSHLEWMWRRVCRQASKQYTDGGMEAVWRSRVAELTIKTKRWCCRYQKSNFIALVEAFRSSSLFQNFFNFRKWQLFHRSSLCTFFWYTLPYLGNFWDCLASRSVRTIVRQCQWPVTLRPLPLCDSEEGATREVSTSTAFQHIDQRSTYGVHVPTASCVALLGSSIFQST